jgi:hypothetical protein
MALSDIFTMPFFFSLGLTLLIVGLLGMFFIQKFQEQNHKIASMLGLVSTMAEELNFIRGRLQYGVQQGGNGNHMTVSENNTSMVNLIPVSDGEDSDEDEDDNDDDEDDEDDEDDDDDDKDEEPENTIIELSNQSVKVINFGEVFDSALENHNIESLNEKSDQEPDNDEDDAEEDDDEEDDHEENDDGDEDIVEDDEDDIDNSNIQLLEMDVLQELQEPEEEQAVKEVQPSVKSINIVTLEESMIDYKKMSLQKLKSIALSKGLIQESSKATKNAILKLLGVE